MTRLSRLVLGLALCTTFGLPRAASATSITMTGNGSFSVTWSSTATNPNLAGSATFTLSNYSSTGFDFSVDSISNDTLASSLNARLVSFGLGLNYTSVSNLVDGSVFSWGFTNFPAFQAVNVCGFSGNSCAGGSSGGLSEGQSQLGPMTIHFSGDFTNGAFFSPIAVKFQTDNGSFELDACITGSTVCTPTPPLPLPLPNPEPATMVLFGTGLAMVAYRLRRRA